jgi:hypothetical protein
MNKIPIYKSEKDLGLYSTIANDNVVSVASQLCPKDKLDDTDIPHAIAKSHESFDLYPVTSVLVTTGWNRNDDVFLKREMWSARATPEDKPFNFEHEPRKIIGHIIGTRAVDEDFVLIDSDSSLEDVPDKFHLLTTAVIYRQFRDKELSAEIAQLIDEIEAGQWYVSMEVLFSDFDYAMMDAEGSYKVVNRCEDTAFLTQHLKKYGGTGSYNGNSLGRVLKNMTFSGKGLVENPANPESIIFENNQTKIFVGNANLTESGDNSMDINEELKTQVASLKSELAEARKRMSELDEQAVAAKLEAKDSEIQDYKNSVESKQNELDEVAAKKSELDEQVKSLQEDLDKANASIEEKDKQIKEANDKLTEIAKQVKKSERVSALVSKGLEKAEAEEIADEFSELSDEKFDKVVAMQEKLHASSNESSEDNSSEDEEDDGESSAANTDLDTDIEEENNTVGSSSDSDNEDEHNKLMSDIAKCIGQGLGVELEEDNN